MTPTDIVIEAINPALEFLPPKMDTPIARVMLLAIGLQESKFEDRYQVLEGTTRKGPARSFWQGEQGGGMVLGVMTHPATKYLARAAITQHGVEFETRAVWLAIEHDDVLAAILARLLLWSDPRPLPALDDAHGGWDMYLRNWRPGKPHPEDWPENFEKARVVGVPGL